MEKKIVILGAGIAGLSAYYHLKKKGYSPIIIEKDLDWGGLCGNFSINGFRFDRFVHLSFTADKYVRELFDSSTDYITHHPIPYNFYNGLWIKHPLQNNTFPLPTQQKIKLIKDFFIAQNVDTDSSNYETWLRSQYGDYYAEEFGLVYTKKYWKTNASELDTSWIGNRLYKPTIDGVLEGAFTDDTPNTYYAKEMRYPTTGGYKSFLRKLAEGAEIKLNASVINIDLKKKTIRTSGNEEIDYHYIISTIPLPEVLKATNEDDECLNKHIKNLKWTSGVLVSLGFNKVIEYDEIWFYIYNNDIQAARVYLPSNKSKDNVPLGKSSLQAEVYINPEHIESICLDKILNDSINELLKIGIFKEEDIEVKDARIEKYANVVFTHETHNSKKIIRDFLKSRRIFTAGRFGEWEYFWSDQSLLSGMNAANELLKVIES